MSTDAEMMKSHLIACQPCTEGDYCDVGLIYGGEVTVNYLYRQTIGNGCIPRPVITQGNGTTPESQLPTLTQRPAMPRKKRTTPRIARNKIFRVELDPGIADHPTRMDGAARHVRVHLGATFYVDISVQDNAFYLNSAHAMDIVPHVSNAISIKRRQQP